MKKVLAFLTVAVIVAIQVAPAAANTVASSTMYFQGTLTDAGGGVLQGTIDAIAGTYYSPGGPGTTLDNGVYYTPDGFVANGGWDVYAKEGEIACYDDVAQGTIGADHDAYPEPGGWGDFYSPDVADWYNYQLTFDSGKWYLEYKGTALGTPMSGAMDWTTMYASEDDTGSYRGTVPADPDANDGGAAALGGGAGTWDMDWTWGSEVIPLEYAGFAVDITATGAANEYLVSLTPSNVPEPTTFLIWSVLGVLGVSCYARRK